MWTGDYNDGAQLQDTSHHISSKHIRLEGVCGFGFLGIELDIFINASPRSLMKLARDHPSGATILARNVEKSSVAIAVELVVLSLIHI